MALTIDPHEQPPDGSEAPYARPSGERRGEKKGDDYWVDLARQAFESSTSYLDAEVRSHWARAQRHFDSKHANGSKYLSDVYKARSKHFRPVTRSASRMASAACGAAFFSSADAVVLEAYDDNDPMQVANAAITQEIVNYRLAVTVPWFLTLTGAHQDADIMGICVSKQWWEFSERVEEIEQESQVEAMDPATGMAVMIRETQTVPVAEVIQDRPRVDLIPPENFRFDPGAEWTRIVEDSPYLIHLLPMYAGQVKARMARGADTKTGQPAWRELDHDLLASATTQEYRSTERDRDRNARSDTRARVRDHEIVWIHEVIIRDDEDRDVVFHTLGPDHMLSVEPVPIEEVYPHGRPYVVGFTNLEAHRAYPTARLELLSPPQDELNDLVNLRIDAARLASTPTTFVRRGARVDLAAITRRAPGRPIIVGNVDADVRDAPGPPARFELYNEEDRMRAHIDDVAGHFSPSSVQTNRSLNETVGGMHMVSSAANSIGEFDLVVFRETWVEPVLRQVVKLVRHYETDTVVLGLAAQKAKLWERFGLDDVTDDLLDQDLRLSVNVGIGATNPMQRIQRLLNCFQAFYNIIKPMVEAMGPTVLKTPAVDAIAGEIFGAAGYKDGKRFLAGLSEAEDPRLKKLTDKIKELEDDMQVAQLRAQAGIQETQISAQAKLADAEIRSRADLERTRIEAAADRERTMLDNEAEMARTLVKERFGRANVQDQTTTQLRAAAQRSQRPAS